MSPVLALALKDLRLLLRDKGGAFFTFIWPLMSAVVFGSVFAGGRGNHALPVVVVDEDRSEASRALVKALEDGDAIEVVPAATRTEAEDLVRRGKRSVYAVLPAGYGAAATDLRGPPPRIEMGADPTRKAESAMASGILTAIAARMRFPVGAAAFKPVDVATIDVAAKREGPPSSYSFTFPQGIAWGLIGACAAFALTLVTERTRGTLVRLVTAPISPTTVLFGKALSCLLTACLICTVLMAIGAAVFGVRVRSLPLLALGILSAGTCFAGLQTLVGTLGKTEASASGMSWALLLAMAMFGGAMVPLFFMPPWMLAASAWSPVRWTIFALEAGIWREVGIAEVVGPCAILVGIGVAAFFAGTRLLRVADR
jgi:ABC-2 type transport system permease protein